MNEYKEMSIDIETMSTANLAEVGVHKYTEAPGFRITLISYAMDDGPVVQIDLTTEKPAEEFFKLLQAPYIQKFGFNAEFEIVCLSKHFGISLDPSKWTDTKAIAINAGLPHHLRSVADALGLSVRKFDPSETDKLLNTFAKIIPEEYEARKGGISGEVGQDFPRSKDPKGWERFKEYNRNDVEVERAVRRAILFPLAPQEQTFWETHQKISGRGIKLDHDFAMKALAVDQYHREELRNKLKELTGLNIITAPKMKQYIETQGIIMRELLPETLREEIAKTQYMDDPGAKKRGKVLSLYLQYALSSNGLYETMLKNVCDDGRIRGLLSFYGESHTGKWAGKRIPLQTMPRTMANKKSLDAARKIIKRNDLVAFNMLYEGRKSLNEMIRTAIIPEDGARFITGSLQNIESRVLSWIAGEAWRNDVFRGDGRIYEAAAAKLFGVNVEQVTDEMKIVAEVTERALMYGGGISSLYDIGGPGFRYTKEEAGRTILAWRAHNPSITKLWEELNKELREALAGKKKIQTPESLHRIGMFIGLPQEPGVKPNQATRNLVVKLPSWRYLRYVNIVLERGHVLYDDPHKPGKRDVLYGAKLVEDITKAIARDVLAEKVEKLEKHNYPVIFHTEDSIVTEVPYGKGSARELREIMERGTVNAWGLNLQADAFESEYYTN